MIPGGVNELLLRSAAAGGATAGRSVRFNSADSAYLSRTPASAGNRKTWTWAGWVKRSALGSRQAFFSNLDAGASLGFLAEFTSGDALDIYDYSTTYQARRTTTQVFRDASAWYHILIQYDSTNSIAANRLRLYVNGAQVTAFSNSTDPTLNADGTLNTAVETTIGRSGAFASLYFNGYLALVHFIDGQALTPSSFGETSATTGQWIAKTYSGSYGTNGFFLDFLDNSSAAALGYDAAGSNDWTVNNIQATAGVDSWSGYFDGTGDSLTVNDNSAFTLGSGDFTVEAWVYPTTTSVQRIVAGQAASNAASSTISFWLDIDSANKPRIQVYSGSTSYTATASSAVGSNQWIHLAGVRNGNTLYIYVNGTQAGSVSVTGVSVNDSTYKVAIGQLGEHTNVPWSGYISNFRLVKGTAVYTAAFTPPTSPLTAITNTSLLTLQSSTFVDNSANNFTITANGDVSVNSFDPFYNPAGNDSLRDSPTNGTASTGGDAGGVTVGNYATWNPLDMYSGMTLADGNLEATGVGTTWRSVKSTLAIPGSGKWYFEMSPTHTDGVHGVGTAKEVNSNYCGATTEGWGFQSGGYYNSTYTAGASYSANDVLMVAIDRGAQKLWFGVNGTWVGSGNPGSGTNATFSNLPASDPLFPMASPNSSTKKVTLNAGQRAFSYAAPTGFSGLCTANLPAPTIVKPSSAMDVVLYTGTGSALTPTSTLGFNPDLVWIKGRSGATDHALYDAVRGVEKRLESNTTDAEVTSDGGVTAFNSDGFSLGTLAQVNTNSATYVAWTWDAGSSNATNTSGTITSTVRANISAGFSIVTYTGNGTAGATIGHGLGVKPSLLICKDRDDTTNWIVQHVSTGATQRLELNTTGAAAAVSTLWNDTEPTSTVFTVGTNGGTNDSGEKYVVYAWTPVAGYSAFGSYTGNGSTDGPFVHLGFRPKWLLIKCSSSATNGNWWMLDATRSIYNYVGDFLSANTAGAENANAGLDFLSNGFKLRDDGAGFNSSAQTFIYAAFAESPFQYARAR